MLGLRVDGVAVFVGEGSGAVGRVGATGGRAAAGGSGGGEVGWTDGAEFGGEVGDARVLRASFREGREWVVWMSGRCVRCCRLR